MTRASPKQFSDFQTARFFGVQKWLSNADGPAAGPNRLPGSKLDIDSGQDDTSLHFPSSGKGLPSEIIPYVVLPGGSFCKNTGLALGDLATVIFKDKVTAAICGDIGPSKKIGEGSIRLHEGLHPPAPDPCSLRNPDGSCKRILNASIEEDVLFFVYPGSAFDDDFTLQNLEAKVKERAYALFNRLRGAS